MSGTTAGRRGPGATRERILAAARELLADPGGIEAFTVGAVARRAGVTRVTVYNQFGSKGGLVDAVFDTLAIVRYGVERLRAALQLPDPASALGTMIEVLATVWQEDRDVIRRLQGLSALDPDFARVWRAREGRRREGLGSIVARVDALAMASPAARNRVTDLLFALVAFETFDAVSGPARPLGYAAPAIRRLALRELGLEK